MKNDISIYKMTQMMITKDFEVYHYRDSNFNSPDFHNHDFYEVYLFLDGNVTYYIEEKVYDLCAGDILLIPPGKMHRPIISNSQTVYERIVLWLNCDYLTSLDTQGENLINNINMIGSVKEYIINLGMEDFSFITNVFQRLIHQSHKLKNCSQTLTKSYISIILFIISMKFKDSLLNEQQQNENMNIIPEVIKYINEHLLESLSLDDICNEFFISKFHLIRKFKEYTNSTVYDYIITKRIIVARKLIRQGITATNACEQCGFSDYSNFYKSFTSKTGMTPSQFKIHCNL